MYIYARTRQIAT